MTQKCWRKLPILDEMSKKTGQVQDAFSTTSDQHNDPIFAEHIVHGPKNPPEKETCKNIHPLGQDESPKDAKLREKLPTGRDTTVALIKLHLEHETRMCFCTLLFDCKDLSCFPIFTILTAFLSFLICAYLADMPLYVVNKYS